MIVALLAANLSVMAYEIVHAHRVARTVSFRCAMLGAASGVLMFRLLVTL